MEENLKNLQKLNIGDNTFDLTAWGQLDMSKLYFLTLLSRDEYAPALEKRPSESDVTYIDPASGNLAGYHIGQCAVYPDSQIPDGMGLSIVKEIDTDTEGLPTKICWLHLSDVLNETETRLTEVEQCNVVAEEVIDQDTFEDFEKVTREELKKDLFIDMWERACKYNGQTFGKYDAERQIFMLNDVELSYEEALYTYQRSASLYEGGSLCSKYYQDRSLKTVFPIPFGSCSGKNDTNMSGIFAGCSNLEIVVINTNYNAPSALTTAFGNCSKLREIRGAIQNPYYTVNALLGTFRGCSSLQKVHVEPAGEGLDFSDCPLLELESLQNSIKKSFQNPVTITVHQNIYSALTGSASEYPFNGGSQEEWEQLLQDALSKNISFATA